MSIWIRAICKRSVPLAGEDLRAGIAQRLRLLIALYCPDDEEPADQVLPRLGIEPLKANVWALHYRDGDHVIRIDRWQGAAAQNEARELKAEVTGSQPGVARIRALLDEAVEITGFELRRSDADSMAWPIAIAAAVSVAAQGDGLIHAEGEGWMEPTATEIRPVR